MSCGTIWPARTVATATSTWAVVIKPSRRSRPEPAKAKLINQNDAASAKEGLERRGEGVDNGEEPSSIRSREPDKKTCQVESAGQPKGDLHKHGYLGPEE